MHAATKSTQRSHNEQARTRALVRFNGSTFHSLAAASFLETAVPQQAGRLAQTFGADPDVALWLEQIWWPRRAELGRQLRAYFEATWPEFDWSAAYHEFRENYRPRSGLEGPRARVAREALGQCATAAQAALFYRALANSADEPELRALMRKAAGEHAVFFDFFRSLYERLKRVERVGLAATLRTVTAVCRSARDHDVAVALEVLGRNWTGAAIVPGLEYADIRQRVARLLLRHAAPGLAERFLFRSWLEREPAVPAPNMQDGRPIRCMPALARPAVA